MKEQLEKLVSESEEIMATLRVEAGKFIEKGNNAAGTRARAAAMDLTKKMKEIRTKVSEIKNA